MLEINPLHLSLKFLNLAALSLKFVLVSTKLLIQNRSLTILGSTFTAAMARILIKEVESLLETKYHINIKIADADDNLRYHIIGNKIYNNKMLLVTFPD